MAFKQQKFISQSFDGLESMIKVPEYSVFGEVLLPES